MTKKHFKLIAEALRKSRPYECHESFYHRQWLFDVCLIAQALKDEFENFNKNKFIEACKKVD